MNIQSISPNNSPLYRLLNLPIILAMVFFYPLFLYADIQQPQVNNLPQASVITDAPWQVVPPLKAETTTLVEKGFNNPQELFGNINRTSFLNFTSSIAFSPDGKSIISGSGDKTIKHWSVETGQLLQTFKGHKHWVLSVAFSPDGKSIISGSKDGTIRHWQIDAKQPLSSSAKII